MKVTEKITLPLEEVRGLLKYLGIKRARPVRLKDDVGYQIKLKSSGFEKVNINVYDTKTVVVQGRGAAVTFVRTALALRSSAYAREQDEE